MKTTSAVIKLILRTSKPLSNGTFPILLRCSWKGLKEISTGCSCSIKYWDKKNEMVRKGYPSFATINQWITKLKQDAINRRNEFELNKIPYTPSMVLRKKQILTVDNTISSIMASYCQSLSPTTLKTWKSFERSFISFGGDMAINEIDLDVIKSYAKHLEKRGLRDGSILMFLSKLNCLLKYSIEKNIISANPFEHFNFCKKYKVSYSSNYIDCGAIDVLKQMLLDELVVVDGDGFKYKDDALNDFVLGKGEAFVLGFYLFGFTAFGLSPIDLCLLKIDDMMVETIDNNNFLIWQIKRRKTNVPLKIMINQSIFFNKVIFGAMLMLRRGYLLPILDNVDSRDKLKTYKKVSNWLSNHRKTLKIWFERANQRIIKHNVENNDNMQLIDVNSTFYSYRSSFAMSLMTKGGNLMQLSSMLGRGVNQSLKAYIKNLQYNNDIANATYLLEKNR